jgi:methionyl-tRNA formyltransferase
MSEVPAIALFVMTAKGLAVLRSLLEVYDSKVIAYVVVSKDEHVVNDYYDEIVALARQFNIVIYDRSHVLPPAQYAMAVSWRWMIKFPINKLVVFHDSMLPRYRGFAPLVNALISGETRIGVTALLASEEYDTGPIVAQEVVNITYPLTIAEAIDLVKPCYQRLAVSTVKMLIESTLRVVEQNEDDASYSLWRDDQDYRIDWTRDAEYIHRFINAVGYPYKGAFTSMGGERVRIMDSEIVADVVIENRDVGKVIFVQEGCPVIVCGKGLLKLLFVSRDDVIHNILPLKKFRNRFL